MTNLTESDIICIDFQIRGRIKRPCGQEEKYDSMKQAVTTPKVVPGPDVVLIQPLARETSGGYHPSITPWG
jgi:hypothetical protein